eukprot:3418136-Amphidinium_carterae.1
MGLARSNLEQLRACGDQAKYAPEAISFQSDSAVRLTAKSLPGEVTALSMPETVLETEIHH